MFESDDEKKQFEQDIKDGMKNKEISKKYGISTDSVKRLAIRNGIDVDDIRQHLYEKKCDEVIRLYTEGYSVDSIRETMHMSESTVMNIVDARFSKFEKSEIKDNRGDQKQRKPLGSNWHPMRRVDPNATINDKGKLMALHRAGWCIEKISDEFGVTIQEVERCLKMLNSK